MSKLEVDIDKVIEFRITLDHYFILYSLHSKKSKDLAKYLENIAFADSIFEKLEEDGFITISNKDGEDIMFSDLQLTDKGRSIFAGNVDELFKEFRACYPTSVRQGSVVKRLHQDLARCKKLYEEALREVTHEQLCKCARMYHMEKVKSNSEWYTQLLATWLHQKNYQQYLEEVDKPEEEGGFVRDI